METKPQKPTHLSINSFQNCLNKNDFTKRKDREHSNIDKQHYTDN